MIRCTIFIDPSQTACRGSTPRHAKYCAGSLQTAHGCYPFADTAYGKDVARGASHFVYDARCLPHDDFTYVVPVYLRYDAAGVWEHRQLRIGLADDAVGPCGGNFTAATLACNPILPVPEPLHAARRPLYSVGIRFHRRLSALSIALTSSDVYSSPRSISASAALTSSRSSSVSVSSYGEEISQSITFSSIDVGLPFWVTMMGRCVRRVFSMYSPSLLRHSVKDITSSDRIGRRMPGRSAMLMDWRPVLLDVDFAFVRVDIGMISVPYYGAYYSTSTLLTQTGDSRQSSECTLHVVALHVCP